MDNWYLYCPIWHCFQRYENRINTINTQVATPACRIALGRIAETQNMPCPVKPELWPFTSTIKSLIGKDTLYNEGVEILKDVFVAWKDSLRLTDLRKAILDSANLYKANLNGADFSYADLMSADLIDADLREAKLDSANFMDAIYLKKTQLLKSYYYEYPPINLPALHIT